MRVSLLLVVGWVVPTDDVVLTDARGLHNAPILGVFLLCDFVH